MIDNFQLLLNVIVYFLNFSGIICLMFVSTFNFNYFMMVEQLFTNWGKGFITDIKIKEKVKAEIEKVCPDNYDYLFSYYWPGTKSGCDCLGVRNITFSIEKENKLLIGACSNTLIKYGCSSVPELPSKYIHSLGDQFFCGLRSNFNYYENYNYNIFYGDCPLHMKNCGIVDTLDNIMCINENDNCPFEIFSDNVNISYVNSDFNTTEKGNFYLMKDLPYLVKLYSRYFVEFAISQSDICINSFDLNIYDDEIYELYNLKKGMKCNTKLSRFNENLRYDTRYNPILISQTDLLFYKEDFLINNIANLPKFSFNYFNHPIKIYGRKYIGWNKNCKDYFIPFIETYNLALRIQKYSIFYLIYSMVTLIYCMLFIMILKELINQKYALKLIIILIHVLLIGILFIMILIDNVAISNAKVLCYKLIRKRCSDDQTNLLMINVLESFKNISSLLVMTIIFYLIIILLSLIKILLTIFKLFKRSLINRIIQGNVNEFEMMLIV